MCLALVGVKWLRAKSNAYGGCAVQAGAFHLPNFALAFANPFISPIIYFIIKHFASQPSRAPQHNAKLTRRRPITTNYQQSRNAAKRTKLAAVGCSALFWRGWCVDAQ